VRVARTAAACCSRWMWWAVLVSLLAPGFGQALVHRRRRAGAWAAGALLSVLGIVWSVWLYPIALLVRVASAIDAGVVLRRDARPGGLDRAAAAVMVVIGAVGLGYSQLAIQSFRIPTSSMYPTIEIGDHLFVDKLTPRWRPIERGELVVHRYPCDPRIVYVKRVVAVGGDTVEVRCDVLYVNGKAVPHVAAGPDEYEDRDEESGTWIRKTVTRWHEQLDGRAYDVYESASPGGERDFPRLDAAFPPGCSSQAMYRSATSHEVHGEIVDAKPGATACEPQRHYVVPKGALFGLGDNRYNANDSRYWGAFPADDVIGRIVGVWYNDGQGGLRRVGSLH
jgi:signal peptidase I